MEFNFLYFLLFTYIITLIVDLGRTLFDFYCSFRKKQSDIITLQKTEVAFVIPCYNSADVIAGTLKTIPKGYKVICVLNGCTDTTEEIIKNLNFHHVEILHSEKGKMRAVITGAKLASKLGFTHFVLLDDDVEWTYGKMPEIKNKKTALTALPVIPTQPANVLHSFQVLEYQTMVVSKFAQSHLNNVIMASGAAGIHRIDTFLDIIKYHDGEHIGDDLQTSYLHHLYGFKIDFIKDLVIRTHPPAKFKDWWKQRAHRWEISPLHNLILSLKILFLFPGKGPGWWIRTIIFYRLFVFGNDLARIVSFPFVLVTNPIILIGVWAITYVSMLLRLIMYHTFFNNYFPVIDKILWYSFFTYPLYGFMTWCSRVRAIPSGVKQLWKYKQRSLLKSIVEI